MKNVTILGEFGTTFSSVAWGILMEKLKLPIYADSKVIPAHLNGDILRMTIDHGGYGVIALNTRCDGRVEESIDSFAPLLQTHTSDHPCPIHIIGAVELKLNICLMVRTGVLKSNIQGIIGHSKALKACKKNTDKIQTIKVANAGEAARLIATDPRFASYAALGPCSAAEKYNLHIIKENFQDETAITTFALVGPTSIPIEVGKINQSIAIFSTYNIPAALSSVLDIFARKKINLSHIESVHIREDQYHFITGFDQILKDQVPTFNTAVTELSNRTTKSLVFGPFPVFLA